MQPTRANSTKAFIVGAMTALLLCSLAFNVYQAEQLAKLERQVQPPPVEAKIPPISEDELK